MSALTVPRCRAAPKHQRGRCVAMFGYVAVGQECDLCEKSSMSYRVTKTIKGRRYIYEQRTWREGKRVRTQSRYIGPVDAQPARRRLGQKIADFIAVNMM